MADINYAQNEKYFKPVSYKPGIISIVIGVLLLFFASFGPVVIGLLLIGLGCYLIYRQTADRPTDADFDHQISIALGGLRKRALEKLDLDESEVELIKPVIVGGKIFGGTSDVKRGKDGIYRTSECEGIVIFFAEQELHAFKYQVSLVNSARTKESTDVYFYRDVVSVSTRSDSIPVRVDQAQVPVHLDVFRLTTSGGTNIECSMGAAITSSDNEIRAARQLIRDKKINAS
ncbi:intracellular growth attenuator family protein [Kribbella sp. NBC_00662]|uniref:hypothetical protein n=1 Tax=Kribbella sp. NBC_00662 TaxID=2975969 RepID=UPI00324F919F